MNDGTAARHRRQRWKNTGTRYRTGYLFRSNTYAEAPGGIHWRDRPVPGGDRRDDLSTMITEGNGKADGRAPGHGAVDRALPVTGPATTAPGATRVAAPRLARHTFELSDGHRIGLAVCG